MIKDTNGGGIIWKDVSEYLTEAKENINKKKVIVSHKTPRLIVCPKIFK